MTASTCKPRTDWPAIEQSIIDAIGPDRIIEEYRTIGIRFSGGVRSNGVAECYAYDRDEAKPSAYVNTTTGKYGDKGGDGTAREITLWQVAADLGHYGGTWEAARAYFAELAQIELPSAGLRGGGKRGRGRSSGRSSSKSSTNYRPTRKPVTPATPAENYRTALAFEPWETTGASGRTYTGQIDILRRFLATHKPGITAEAFIAAGGRRARYKCDRPKKDDAGKEIADSFHEPQWTVYALPVFGETILTATPDDLAKLTGPAEPIAYACWSSNPIGNPLTRWNAETKTPEPIKMKIVGSADGVFGLPSLRRRAAWLAGGGEIPPAVVGFKVEGPTDLLALETAAGEDFLSNDLAFSTAGGATQFNAWHAELYRGLSAVYAVGDHDRAGVAGVVKACGVMVETGSVERSALSTVALFDGEPDPKHGRDLRDYFAAGSSFADFRDAYEFDRREPWTEERHAEWRGSRSTDASASPASQEDNNSDNDNKNDLQPIEAADDPHRLARDFVARYASIECDGKPLTTIRRWREEWHRWCGRDYRSVGEADMKDALNKSIKEEFDRLNIAAQEVFNDRDTTSNDYNPDEEPPTARKVSRTLVSDVAAALSGMTSLPSDSDAPFWISGNGPFPSHEVFATGSGIIHLQSLFEGNSNYQLPITPDFFSPNSVHYRFPDDDLRKVPTPTRWFEFLSSLWGEDHEMITLLQEWMGYCLLPDTSQQKIMLMIGPPRSGKGTICRVLTELVGELNVVNPRLSSFGTEFGIEPLIGKTVGIVSDARLSGRSDIAQIVETLLSISGEDKQTVRRMYKSSINTRLRLRFMIVSNELPALQDASGAFLNRCLLLQTNRSFLGSEDKALEAALRDELPGIMVWAAQGWWSLRERGRFVQPASSKELFDELYSLTSPIKAFLDECCDVETGGVAMVDDTYAAYRKWCETQGRKASTRQMFGRDLRAAMPHVKTEQLWNAGDRHRAFIGIKLRNELT